MPGWKSRHGDTGPLLAPCCSHRWPGTLLPSLGVVPGCSLGIVSASMGDPISPTHPRRGHGDSLLPHPLSTSRGLCCSRVQPCSGLNGFPVKNQGRMLTSFSHYGDCSLPCIFQGLPLVIPPAGISPGRPPSPFFQVQGWELSGLRAPQGSPRIWGQGGLEMGL